MVEDKIIARFTADIEQYKSALIELESKLNKLSKTESKTEEDRKSLGATAASASQKRSAALKNEEAELKRLKVALKNAFTVTDIEKFNTAISKTKTNISTLKGEASGIGKSIGGLKSQFGALGAGIAAAFTVDAIIQFGKASVQAFIEAEENATRLRNAVVGVANDTDVAFNRLLDQSAKLQSVTIFDDDSIQKSQTQLINFGLTVDQVERLTPAILDLAKANKIDLAQATSLVISGINGQTRALRPLGIAFKDTGDKSQNLENVLTRINSKFEGQSKVIETTSDKINVLKNKYGEFQECIGGAFIDAFDKALNRMLDFENKGLSALLDVLNPIAFFKSALTKSATELKREQESLLRQVSQDRQEQLRKLSDEQLSDQLKFQERNINLLYKAAANAIKSGNATLAKERQGQIKILESQLANINAVIEDRKNAAEITKQDNEDKILAAQKAAADAAKKAMEDEAKAKEEQFQRELTAIETQANIKKTIAANELTDADKLAKALTKITEDQLADSIDLYNRYSRDVSALIGQLAKENVDVATDAAKKRDDEIKKEIKKEEDAADAYVKAWKDALEEKADAEKKARDKKAKEDKEAADKEIEDRQRVIDESFKLANNISSSIFKVTSENLRRTQDRDLKALDDEKNAVLSNKRLTEAQKERINKEYAAKELALKKKAFNENKQLTIAEAVIRGALAVIEALASTVGYPANLVLAAAAAAATAVEIATINATKFAKGTKGAKPGMALVGEEGPEFMYVPQGAKILTAKQTQNNSRVIDAIYDNRLEKLIHHEYILPALERQKRETEKRNSQTFSDNLAKSFIFNGLTGNEMEKIRNRGTKINNTDELALKIASAMSTNKNRRRF